jgi:hypothetical protein
VFDAQGRHVINLSMRLGVLHPTRFRVIPDDCLLSLRINGREIPVSPESCDYKRGYVLSFAGTAGKGENTIEAHVDNRGNVGGIDLRADPADPVFLLPIFLFLLAIVIAVVAVVLRLRWTHPGVPLVGVIVVGILLRFLYVIRTAFGERAYDADGHLEYIRYLLERASLPPAQGGWEFFQPPLYYVLNALVGLPATVLGISEYALPRLLQGVSLGLSCAALAIGVWIAVLLFPSAQERRERFLIAAAFAVFPGLVLFASRLSNDSLIVTLSFGFFAFLLRWWKTGNLRDWAGMGVCIALAVLTKSNALAWLAIPMGLLLLRKGMPWLGRIRLGAILLTIVVVLAGWFFAYRFVIEGQSHLVGNIGSNNPALRIQTIAPENLLTFRPHEVLRYPFNSSWEDTYGRRYFWEHLFKSSIVGEWNFGQNVHDLTRILFVAMMLLCLAAIAGLAADLQRNWRANAPLWLTGVILIASMMALVLKEPIGGFQDFRYVPLLLVPVAFYALKGIQLIPPAWRVIGWQTVTVFLVCCGLFTGYLMQI